MRLALQKEGLYEKWDVAAQEGLVDRPLEAESVNKTADKSVSF